MLKLKNKPCQTSTDRPQNASLSGNRRPREVFRRSHVFCGGFDHLHLLACSQGPECDRVGNGRDPCPPQWERGAVLICDDEGLDECDQGPRLWCSPRTGCYCFGFNSRALLRSALAHGLRSALCCKAQLKPGRRVRR